MSPHTTCVTLHQHVFEPLVFLADVKDCTIHTWGLVSSMQHTRIRNAPQSHTRATYVNPWEETPTCCIATYRMVCDMTVTGRVMLRHAT